MEDVITSAEHVPSEKTVQALREQLDQDTRILASLDPNSDTHRRLADRVEQRTAELLNAEDQRERQHQATQHAMIEQHRRDQEVNERTGAGAALLVGVVVSYAGWGTWWLVLGIVLILGGLCGLFAKDI